MDKLEAQNEVWESAADNFSVIEESSEVDGQNILAKVVGPAFFPNTTSRNKVYYSKEAWENAINTEDFQSKLSDRLVYGTIGHKLRLDDEDIREGRLSHIVSKVWINEESGVGEAEYLILNTPPGKILNTLMRAKSKLRVSTKAKGLFESNGIGGIKSIDPDNFMLERIDFVIDPGYLKAHPDLVESFDKLENNTNSEEIQMSETNKVVEILEERIQELKQDNTVASSVAEDLSSKLSTIGESLAAATATIETFSSFGTVKEITEAFALLNSYKELGTVESIEEAFTKSSEVIDNLTATIETQSEEIAESISAETINEELDSYKELGSVDELKEVIESAEKMATALINAQITKIATKYKVEESLISKLIDKGLEIDDIEESFELMKPSEDEITIKESKKKELSTEDFKKSPIEESKASKVASRAASLMSHSKKS